MRAHLHLLEGSSVLHPHLRLPLRRARRSLLNGSRMHPAHFLQDPGSLRPANDDSVSYERGTPVSRMDGVVRLVKNEQENFVSTRGWTINRCGEHLHASP